MAEPELRPWVHAARDGMLAVEEPIICRLKDCMPELCEVLRDSFLLGEDQGSLLKQFVEQVKGRTPAAFVQFRGWVPEETPPSEATYHGLNHIYLRYMVLIGVDTQRDDCDGVLARALLGPLMSRVLGVPGYQSIAEGIDIPGIKGVLPGWRPGPQYGPLELVRAEFLPPYFIHTCYGFIEFEFVTQQQITGCELEPHEQRFSA